MPNEITDGTPVALSDLINRVLDKGAVIAGSVTISVADIDLIQLDLTVVLRAIETARAADAKRQAALEAARADLPVLPAE